ncbi:hypothetical protein OIU80_15045 [Flavobacterium sp. LS1R47]|uniref:Uncharacterized protein n=1 Tax=Flavobacterium frigoritolerans TaxID=2987686 RepID=A0A9X2ZQ47_9FLAO|nr:hypothetical protein [Flavobacterium frigoritolerans]MCV9933600.1 hypothetical protein [Flavobacterium frigoritolerans]
MKKYLKYSLFLVAIGTFYSCSNDDSKPEDPKPEPVKEAVISLKLASDFTVSRYNAVAIDPEVTIENSNNAIAQYKWTIKVTHTDGTVKDSIIGDTKTLQFIAPKAANYAVDLTVTLGKLVKQAATKVTVSETGKTYISRALSLIDYLPAPSYNNDNLVFGTKAEVMTQIQSDLIEGNDIGLGTFGGFIVTKFDHTVINTYGKRDFTILMNENSGSLKFSPVSVYVAYDANKNGIADENEWYEIAGSEHHKSTTIKNYEVTYNKPNPDKPAVTGTKDWQFDKEYLKWTDNKNESSFITKTKKWRRYNYYPQWMGESYTLKGTKINLPIKDVSDGEGTTYNVGTFEWGYGGIKDPSIDISWAVDNNGKKVHLPGIDFVKVYVSTFVVAGATDLVTSHFKQAEDLNFPKTK